MSAGRAKCSLGMADITNAGIAAWYVECGVMPRNGEPGVAKPRNGSTSGGGRWEKYAGAGVRSTARWADVDAKSIGELVQAVSAIGDAVLFGVVAGGGALVVTICSGEQRYKRYANGVDEAEAMLAELENIACDARG